MADLLPIDTDPDPSPNKGARRLRKYWTRGEGALKINWQAPGSFSRCVSHLRKHVGLGAEGLCAVYYKDAKGHWPGKNKGKKDMTAFFTKSDIATNAITDLIVALDEKAGETSSAQRSRLMQESRARMNRNDANERQKAQSKAKQRRIRTQAGAKRYGGNIGDVITTKKVEKGDTLWDLAKAQYGDPQKWKLIAKANGIDDPRKLPIGKELVFPPDPDKKNTSTGTTKKATNKAKSSSSGSSSKSSSSKNSSSKNSSDDDVDLEATYYAPKDMDIEDVLKKFYGNTDRLDDVLKVNGLDRASDILEGQALILPGIDPKDIYPDKKKRSEAKARADKKSQGRVPRKSPGGATAKATSRGYTLYNDGSVYGAGGWIVSNTKKKAQKRSRAKKNK